ncbi:MAG: AAA family ATPase [Sedimentisphaerales bacterium]|nr:AAA family ATPase [Sedimentisphaerales bacterium]
MKNINNQFENSSNEGLPSNPNPIIQSKDESGNQNGNIQPVETVLRTKRPMPLSDSSLSYGPHAGARNYDKQVWTASYILRALFRYKWSFLLIFILTAGPLLAFIWTQIVPKYQARAEIRVRPIIPFLVYKTEDSGMIPLYSSFLNTQVSIIRSMTVLQRVLDQKDIQNTTWYKKPQKSLLSKLSGKISPMERLRDDLSVRPRRQTEIVDVSFVAVNAKEAKLVVDSVLDKYLQYVKDRSDTTQDELYRQLSDEFRKLDREIQGSQVSIQERLKALGTNSPDELIASKRNSIEETALRLNHVQQSIAILEWDQKKIIELMKNENDQNRDSNDAFAEVPEERQYYADPDWRQLDINVRTIKYKIETSKFTDNNPKLLDLQEDLKFSEDLLKLRESQIDAQRKSMPNNMMALTGGSVLNYEDQLNKNEYQIERAKQEEQILSENLSKQQEEFELVFKSAQSLEQEKQDLAYTLEKFEAVRQRLDQKNTERNVPGSIEILTNAFVPSKPYNDRRVVFSVMVLCLAAGLGLGVSFLRATMNQVILGSQDMPLSIKVPHLGSIPLIRLKNPLGKMLGDEIEKNQIQLFESVRVIRTKLLLQLNNQKSSTVLISSSVAGTGKSSFIKVLGKCIAKTGKKVLMIDTDFYKKTLSRRFGLVDKPGIINYLNSKSLDFSGICQTEIPNLSILPVGKQDAENTMFEGIDNGFFGTYLEALQEKYSVIILDSSPVLPRADTVIMSQHVNGVIMVERELLSRRENMIDAIERVNSAGGHMWGVVFVGSSDFEAYGSYSGYYDSE